MSPVSIHPSSREVFEARRYHCNGTLSIDPLRSDMDESNASRLAELLTRRMRDIVAAPDASPMKEPLTLAAILQMGFFLASTIQEAFPEVKAGFPVSREFLA